jgi:hypothetical protein
MNAIKPRNKLGLVARILSLPILLFTLLIVFAHIIFPDTEPGSYPPIENLLPVLMTFSVLGLAAAWWWEVIGGGISLLFFVAHQIAYWIIRDKFFPTNTLVLFSPVVVNAALFIWSGLRRTRE